MKSKLKCPCCAGAYLYENEWAYKCNGNTDGGERCGFRIYKNYFGKEITGTLLQTLVEAGETEVIDGLTNKNGKSFSAKLKIVDGVVRPVFPDMNLESGCPKCGREVNITGRGYCCGAIREGCDFYIPKVVAGVPVSQNEAERLINGEILPYRSDFVNKEGKVFGARVTLDKGNGVSLIFGICDCPKCGEGRIHANSKAYGCSNYNSEKAKCDFFIWREVNFNVISEGVAAELCEKGESKVLKFKGKEGDYKVKLQLEEYRLVVKKV